MNWNELKACIDEKLSEKGLDGTETIWYIDVSWPRKEEIEVFFQKPDEIYIQN